MTKLLFIGSNWEALETLQKPIINNKKMGDLLFQHFGELQSLLQKILSMKRKGQNWIEITFNIGKMKKTNNYPEIYFHSLDTKNQILNVLVVEKIIPLDFQKSIQENADKYYSRSKKARKKLNGAKKTLEDTKTKIEQAKKQVEIAKKSQKPLVKRKNKEWFEKFRWVQSSDGFLVIGGKDAASNEILIKKYMDPNDVVFHAEIVGAPFVLIKTEGKTPPKRTINEAAQLAASYSRAWKEMLRVINVYWIHPNQVSKTPPSGQSLKKGSFMIRGKKNFVRAVPLSIAVGLKIIDDQIMIIGGPIEAISNQTEVFVEIIPGDHKSSQLAKKIRHKLSTKVSEELKRSVTGISIDEIQAFIPLGRGKIKKD